jgi:hypothetical protein
MKIRCENFIISEKKSERKNDTKKTDLSTGLIHRKSGFKKFYILVLIKFRVSESLSQQGLQGCFGV